MKTQFRRSFARDLRSIKDNELLNRIKETVELVEKAQSAPDVINLKKLKGGKVSEAIH